MSYRDHAFDEDEGNRGAKKRPSSRVSKVEELVNATLEGKMLPEAR